MTRNGENHRSAFFWTHSDEN